MSTQSIAHSRTNPSIAGRDPAQAAKNAVSSPGMALLTRAGYASKGVLYLIIGFLALLAANNAGGDTTDTTGAISAVAGAPFGPALLGVISVGLAGYALWYIFRGLFDLDRKGSDQKALAARAVYVFVGASYVLLVFGAIQLLT